MELGRQSYSLICSLLTWTAQGARGGMCITGLAQAGRNVENRVVERHRWWQAEGHVKQMGGKAQIAHLWGPH